MEVVDVKWALVTETLTLKLPGTTLDGSKEEGKAKTETPHIHATPFEARRGGRYEVHVQPVRRSAETKALPSVSGLKLFVLPPKAKTINQAVARADRPNKDGKQHLAFIAAATGTFRARVEVTAISGGDAGMVRVSVVGVGVEKGFTLTECRWSTPTTRRQQQQQQQQLRWYDVRRIRAANMIKRKYRRHYYKRTKGAAQL